MNDDLEAIDELCAKIIEQRARIEQLEAALREIADALGYIKNEGKHPAVREANAYDAWKIARAAVAPEQDVGCGKSVIEPWSAPEQEK